jgi:threonine aldolase
MGMMAAFAGCQAFPIPTEDGLPAWEQVSQSLRPRDYDYSRNRLIVLENTHNMAGGRAYPPQRLQEFCDQAHSHGLVVHLDGARIFNAAACLQCAVKEIAAPFDSVMFCLSKGLGAPVGSILAGSSGFIEEALRVRKMLGGGMRQAGVLAAAGLVALEKHPPKLFADHRNARSLAETVSRIPGVLINLATVQTNIVIFDLSEMGVPAKDFAEESKQHSVLLDPLDDHRVRMVTHLDVDENACAYAGHVITALADEWNARKQKSGPTP